MKLDNHEHHHILGIYTSPLYCLASRLSPDYPRNRTDTDCLLISLLTLNLPQGGSSVVPVGSPKAQEIAPFFVYMPEKQRLALISKPFFIISKHTDWCPNWCPINMRKLGHQFLFETETWRGEF